MATSSRTKFGAGSLLVYGGVLLPMLMLLCTTTRTAEAYSKLEILREVDKSLSNVLLYLDDLKEQINPGEPSSSKSPLQSTLITDDLTDKLEKSSVNGNNIDDSPTPELRPSTEITREEDPERPPIVIDTLDMRNPYQSPYDIINQDTDTHQDTHYYQQQVNYQRRMIYKRAELEQEQQRATFSARVANITIGCEDDVQCDYLNQNLTRGLEISDAIINGNIKDEQVAQMNGVASAVKEIIEDENDEEWRDRVDSTAIDDFSAEYRKAEKDIKELGDKRETMIIIISCSIGGLVLVIVIIIVVYCYMKNKKKNKDTTAASSSKLSKKTKKNRAVQEVPKDIAENNQSTTNPAFNINSEFSLENEAVKHNKQQMQSTNPLFQLAKERDQKEDNQRTNTNLQTFGNQGKQQNGLAPEHLSNSIGKEQKGRNETEGNFHHSFRANAHPNNYGTDPNMYPGMSRSGYQHHEPGNNFQPRLHNRQDGDMTNYNKYRVGNHSEISDDSDVRYRTGDRGATRSLEYREGRSRDHQRRNERRPYHHNYPRSRSEQREIDQLRSRFERRDRDERPLDYDSSAVSKSQYYRDRQRRENRHIRQSHYDSRNRQWHADGKRPSRKMPHERYSEGKEVMKQSPPRSYQLEQHHNLDHIRRPRSSPPYSREADTDIRRGYHAGAQDKSADTGRPSANLHNMDYRPDVVNTSKKAQLNRHHQRTRSVSPNRRSRSDRNWRHSQEVEPARTPTYRKDWSYGGFY